MRILKISNLSNNDINRKSLLFFQFCSISEAVMLDHTDFKKSRRFYVDFEFVPALT